MQTIWGHHFSFELMEDQFITSGEEGGGASPQSLNHYSSLRRRSLQCTRVVSVALRLAIPQKSSFAQIRTRDPRSDTRERKR